MAGYKQKGDGDEDPVLLLFKAFFFPFCLWPFYSLRARAGQGSFGQTKQSPSYS